MEFIGSFYYLLLLTPGLLQAFIFLVLLGLFTWAKKWSRHRPAAALIGTGLFLALTSSSAPFWVLTHLLIAGLGAALWKRSIRVQGTAIIIAIAIYGLCYREMAEVKADFPSTANWQIGERGTPGSGNPPERLVELKFGVNFDQTEGRFSDSLADYLISRNASTIPVEIPIYYSWGVAYAMGAVRVDGKEFPTNGGGYGSWSASKPQAPFPKYFFGLRSFVSSK